MVVYLTQEWLDRGKAAVNSNAEFRKIAQGMNLTIIHVITGVPTQGTVYFWSTFKDGECVEVQLGKKDTVDFTLTAPYSIWKQIHQGSLEIVQVILEKKLTVEGKPVFVKTIPKYIILEKKKSDLLPDPLKKISNNIAKMPDQIKNTFKRWFS